MNLYALQRYIDGENRAEYRIDKIKKKYPRWPDKDLHALRHTALTNQKQTIKITRNYKVPRSGLLPCFVELGASALTAFIHKIQ